MRAANKTALVDAIWALGECHTTNNTLVNTEIYVLSLMVVLPYNVIHGHEEQYSIDYISYIATMLPRNIQILLLFLTDETGSSTKDNTHLIRSRGKVGAEVYFKEAMFLQSKKDDFLANVVNKQQFIYLLSEKLQQAECTTVHATGDSSIYSSSFVIILGHQLRRH